MASAADILINVVARTARVERQLTLLEKNLQKVAKAARMFRDELFEFAAEKLFTAVVNAVGRLKNLANSLENIAAATSLTVEEVQAFNFAGAQMGISAGHVSRGLQFFARRMAEAANGTGQLKDVVKEYNIQMTNADGSTRSTIEQLNDFADVIAGTESKQKRLLLSTKAFGEENAELIRIFEGGSDALFGYLNAAEDTGNIIDSSILQKTKSVGATFDRIASTIDTRLTVAIASNAEQIETMALRLESMSNFFLGIAEKGPAAFNLIAVSVERAAEGLARLIHGREAADTIEAVNNRIKELKDEVDRLEFRQSTGISLLVPDDAVQRIQKAKDDIAELKETKEKLLIQEERVRKAEIAANQARAAASAEMRAALKGDSGLSEEQLKNYAEALAAIEKRWKGNATKAAELRRILATFGDDLSADTIERINKAIADLEGVDDYGRTLEFFKKRFKSASDEAEEFKKQLDLVKDALTDEELAAAMKEYYRILGLEELDIEKIRKRYKEIDTQARQLETTATRVGEAFGFAFGNAVQRGNDLRSVLQGLLDDIIAILTRDWFVGPISSGLGSLLGDIFSPTSAATNQAQKIVSHGIRAHGGPVGAGQNYVVGEKGPELLMMGSRSGHVMPNTSGHVTNIYNFEAGADVATIRAEIIPLLERTRQVTLNDVAQLQREGRL